jgi:hypothetical protein
VREVLSGKRSLLGAAVKAVSKRELVCMDFFRGVAEMADAIDTGRRCLLSPDFVLHVNELTLAIQRAGTCGAPYTLTTSFAPLTPMPSTLASARSYGAEKPRFLAAAAETLIARLHRH